MVKKLKQMANKKSASPAGLLDGQFAGTVKDSAQQIWLAGLGAFAKAQAEGGKVFDALVKEGVTIQRKTQSAAEAKLGEVAGKMTGMAGEVSSKAGQHWDKLESIFEERTSRALSKLGVPSAKDVAALTDRLDKLTAQMAKMSQGGAAKPARKSAAAKSSAGAKSAAKPAAKKAAAAKRPSRKTA